MSGQNVPGGDFSDSENSDNTNFLDAPTGNPLEEFLRPLGEEENQPAPGPAPQPQSDPNIFQGATVPSNLPAPLDNTVPPTPDDVSMFPAERGYQPFQLDEPEESGVVAPEQIVQAEAVADSENRQTKQALDVGLKADQWGSDNMKKLLAQAKEKLFLKNYTGVIAQVQTFDLDIVQLSVGMKNSYFNEKANSLTIKFTTNPGTVIIFSDGTIYMQGCPNPESLDLCGARAVVLLQTLGYNLEFRRPDCVNITGVLGLDLAKVKSDYKDGPKLNVDLVRRQLASQEGKYTVSNNDNNAAFLTASINVPNITQGNLNEPLIEVRISFSGRIVMISGYRSKVYTSPTDMEFYFWSEATNLVNFLYQSQFRFKEAIASQSIEKNAHLPLLTTAFGGAQLVENIFDPRRRPL